MPKKKKLPYLNTNLTFDERIDDLVSRMTPEEKLSQLLHSSPEIKRLGIPKYNWWNEALHGVARAGIATVFPQAIGLAATFNDELIFNAATAISDEARAKHHNAVRKGFREMFYGLNFWSPNINIFRDPRWGRGQETYGEDPYLTSRMGCAFVKGMQGNDPKYLKTAACAKHFAVHSGPEGIRHTFDAKVSEKDLHETYLPAFKALVKEAKVETVMGAYNRTLGEPCCASKKLLVDILRNEWGFKGHVVSDCGAIHDIYKNHLYTKTAAEAAALSVKLGCDMNCCLFGEMCSESGKGLEKAHQYGLLEEKYVDISLKRVLMTRFKLGMFDSGVKYSEIPFSAVDSPKNRKLALETARQSLVLLKNDGILPLKNVKSLAVIGPNADDIEALLGNYCGFPSEWVTPLAGIKKAAGKKVKVRFLKACAINDNYSDQDVAIAEMAGLSDAVIMVLGMNSTIEGEEGAGGGDGDRKSLDLPKAQQQILKAACAAGKPVIVIIMTGSAVNIDKDNKNIRAIIQAWYPGEEGGTAIGEALFGKYNPAGRLPVTFYKSVDDLPDFKDYAMQSRTYRYFKGVPLYPFGYGLSYTKFKYSNLKMPKAIHEGDSISLSVEVKNAGKMDGDEVVQVYLKYPSTVAEAPLKTLCGIKRVRIKRGKTAVVDFTITREQMLVYNNDGRQFIEPGVHEVCIGGIQPGFEKMAATTGAIKGVFSIKEAVQVVKPVKIRMDDYKGFRVKGRFIYDGNGEKFIIRGVNKMVVWLDPDGEPSFTEIAKTGANAVRIVWTIKDASMEGLELAISNCVKHSMVPIIELHDHTGNWDDVVFRQFNNYWTNPKMVSIIKKYEKYVIVNYGNEIGNDKVTQSQYKSRYTDAILKMRAAGIRVPIMIDPACWGTSMDYFYENHEFITSKDPLKNVIYSIHMWWNDGKAQRVKDAIRTAAEKEIPLVVGEFAVAGPENKGLICYETIIAECHKAGTGWLAWEWGPGNLHGNLMDMTKDSKFDTLWGWAKEVCLDSPYSIKKTAVRPDIF